MHADNIANDFAKKLFDDVTHALVRNSDLNRMAGGDARFQLEALLVLLAHAAGAMLTIASLTKSPEEQAEMLGKMKELAAETITRLLQKAKENPDMLKVIKI